MEEAAQQLAQARDQQIQEWKNELTGELDRPFRRRCSWRGSRSSSPSAPKPARTVAARRAERTPARRGQSRRAAVAAGAEVVALSPRSRSAPWPRRGRRSATQRSRWAENAARRLAAVGAGDAGGGGRAEPARPRRWSSDRERAANAQSASGFAEMLERMREMAKQQGSLNAQAAGICPDAPGQQMNAQSAQQARTLARQQRALAERLDQAGETTGRAEELAREMRQIAEALDNARVDPGLLDRQQRLFRRMLDAGLTLEKDEREDTGKRESKSATGKEGVVGRYGEQRQGGHALPRAGVERAARAQRGRAARRGRVLQADQCRTAVSVLWSVVACSGARRTGRRHRAMPTRAALELEQQEKYPEARERLPRGDPGAAGIAAGAPRTRARVRPARPHRFAVAAARLGDRARASCGGTTHVAAAHLSCVGRQRARPRRVRAVAPRVAARRDAVSRVRASADPGRCHGIGRQRFCSGLRPSWARVAVWSTSWRSCVQRSGLWEQSAHRLARGGDADTRIWIRPPLARWRRRRRRRARRCAACCWPRAMSGRARSLVGRSTAVGSPRTRRGRRCTICVLDTRSARVARLRAQGRGERRLAGRARRARWPSVPSSRSADLLVRAASDALAGGDAKGAVQLATAGEARARLVEHAYGGCSRCTCARWRRRERRPRRRKCWRAIAAWLPAEARQRLQQLVAWAWVRAGDRDRAPQSSARERRGRRRGRSAGWLALYEGDLRRRAACSSGRVETDAGARARAGAPRAHARRQRARTSARPFWRWRAATPSRAATLFERGAPTSPMRRRCCWPPPRACTRRRRDDAHAVPLWQRSSRHTPIAPEAPEAELEWARALRRAKRETRRAEHSRAPDPHLSAKRAGAAGAARARAWPAAPFRPRPDSARWPSCRSLAVPRRGTRAR